VSSVEVDGESATAEAAFTGGTLDGQAVGLSLVKEGDQWKLDSLDEFVTFDKEALANSFSESLSSDEDVPPEVATCIVDELNAADDATIQEAYLSGDEEQLFGLFGTCLGG
jgi:hypothetical protein